MKKSLLWTCCILLATGLSAQFGYRIGYNTSYFPPMRNLQIPVYEFNRTYDGKLNVPRFADGLMLGIDYGIQGGFEFLWMNKGVNSRSKYTVAGTDSIAQIKYRYNSFGIGAFFPISEEHRIGANFDFGNISIQKRRGPSSGMDTTWSNMYDNSNTFGLNIYVNFCFILSDGASFHIRPHYQFVWPIGMPEFGGEDYYFKFHNIGVSASFLFGKGGN